MYGIVAIPDEASAIDSKVDIGYLIALVVGVSIIIELYHQLQSVTECPRLMQIPNFEQV